MPLYDAVLARTAGVLGRVSCRANVRRAVLMLGLAWAGLAGSSALAAEPRNSPGDEYELRIGHLMRLGMRCEATSGFDADGLGDFVVAAVRMGQDRDMGTIQIRARNKIAEFLGVEISGETEHEKEQKVEGVGADRLVTFSSSFRKVTRSRLNQMLAGVSMMELRVYEEHTYALYVLSERDAERASNLAARVRETRETVEAMGMVPVGADLAAARAQAIAAAHLEAISKVAGMVIVADSVVRDNKALHQNIAGRTAGLIASWEVINGVDGVQGEWYVVRILCDVDAGGVFSEYSAFLLSMGNPSFHVRSEEPGLRSRIEGLLEEMGFRITAIADEANYWLNLDAVYASATHPTRGTQGTRLTLGLELLDVGTGEIYSPVRSDGRQTSFLGTGPDRQRVDCEIKVIEHLTSELQASLGAVVQRFTSNGRPIEMLFQGGGEMPAALQESVWESVRRLPGVRSCVRATKDGGLVFTVTYVGRSDFLDSLVRGELALLEEPILQGIHAVNLEYGQITYAWR